MLRHLHIQNYALITHLDIDFNAGWIKGETSFNSGNNETLTVEIYNCSSGGMGYC